MGKSADGVKNASINEIAQDLIEGIANAKIGEKPVVVVTHSLGAIIFKKILEYASKGDPRLQSLLKNLKGVVFISGPHKGASLLQVLRKELQNFLCLTLRFDPMGELAVPLDEALDYLLATSYYSKTTYYVGRKNKSRLEKLQNTFDKLKLNAMCITEGKACRFGPAGTNVVVVNKNEGTMIGYPSVHIEAKNHSEINKVRDETDPTFVAISKFIEESLGKAQMNKP